MTNKHLALVRNIKIGCSFENSEVLDLKAFEFAKKQIKKAGLSSDTDLQNCFVYKKSIDARNRDEIFLVYTVAFPLFILPKRSIKGIDVVEVVSYDDLFVTSKKIDCRPLVVGFGPSGMFCALALAKAGLNPIVIERGADVDTRALKVDAYWKGGTLDTQTNVQFGEGGAGTFSDGKLLTRISDKMCSFVLSEFVRFGAPEEIMYLAKPHIGTDNLRKVVKNIRQEIIRLGGTVRFGETLVSVETDLSGNVISATLENGEQIECGSLFLCIGHSARDTVKNLMKCGVQIEPKPFSVGVRIEHLQKDIDTSLYGSFAGAPSLGVSQYSLSRKYGTRAVYSFCMCPGGVVVASASDNGQIVTNGMSYYARDGVNANSAIAVSVDLSDYGSNVDGAISFQENIEKKAYSIAGNDGAAPIQLLGDFLNGVAVNEPSRILPTYTGKTKVANAHSIFPSFITENICAGICDFENDIKGFSCSTAVLTFPETRTSSPVKIPRDNNYTALGFSNMYPCGEGAGYAGGITSAAVDGLRAAIAFLKG